MSQTSYSANQDAAILGMLADSRYKHTESMIAAEEIPVGRGLARVGNAVDQVQLPALNVGTLTFDGDFVASNSIVITVNGESTAAVDFDTDHDVTAGLVLAAIQGLSTVASAYISDSGTNNRIFVIKAISSPITVAEAVTGGAGQATGTATYSFDTADFFGIAQMSHALEGGLPGSSAAAAYPANALVNALRQGAVYVYFETTFDPDIDTLYVRHTAGGATELVGQFRKDADTSKAVSLSGLPIKVRSLVASAGSLGILEINLP